ncbi:MAG: GFA family protein [Burkholderiaceae bacterium]
MSEPRTGGCLCGAVRYRCTSDPAITGHCHCEDCRRTSGTGHGTHAAFAADAFEIEGETRGYARSADSGNLVTRHFCPTCGSAIYSTNDAMAGLVFVRASSLDDPNRVDPQMVVYASRAPRWDLVDPALPSFAEMPPQMPIDGG